VRLALILLMAAAAHAERAPVLVELFTSEGCSSCPPADRLLQTLDGDAIVLGEHVDYWDRLGWRDPFSSAAFTARQELYSRRLRAEVYTPQMVIDGAEQVLGNDPRAAKDAIARAAKRPKPELHIQATREGAVAVVTVAGAGRGDLWVATADESGRSSVARGVNAGRTLTHVAVARAIVKAKPGQPIRVPVAADPSRVIAFLTDGAGRVTAAAMSPLP
jgi:hypothetical protein